MKFYLFRFSMLGILLLVLSGCGNGLCANQAACPDGSWSSVTTSTGSFRDFIASMLHRDKTAQQMTLRQEVEGSFPTGHRKVPNITKDDEGNSGGSVTYAARPTQVCGTTQDTVEARVAHCALQNTTLASWDGSVSGNAGQGQWKLVTYNGAHEVWRDERTKLIWSDSLGQTNWCRATGSSGGGPFGQTDPSNYCDNVTYQSQVTPESWCTEDSGFSTPGAYDSMKAGMRLTATSTSPSVVWRLPTKWDYHLAEANGIRFALPSMTSGIGFFWTASVVSVSRNNATYFYGYYGYISNINRSSVSPTVRCVGY